jgi:hypothetical protein
MWNLGKPQVFPAGSSPLRSSSVCLQTDYRFLFSRENRFRGGNLRALDLDQLRVRRLGSQPMQEQAVAGPQGRKRHKRMLVVHQSHVAGIVKHLGRVDRDRLIQLERVARAPEV